MHEQEAISFGEPHNFHCLNICHLEVIVQQMLPIPWQVASTPLFLTLTTVSKSKWALLFPQLLVLTHHIFIFFSIRIINKIIAIAGTNINKCKVRKGFTAHVINPFTNKP